MSGIGYVFLFACILWVLSRFQRDIQSGICTFLAFAVFLPELLGIRMPVGVPQPTVHRILLLLALFFVVKNGYFARRTEPIPYFKWILLFGVSQVISLAAGVSFGPGLKAVIDYSMEVALFFVLITVYVQQEKDVVRLLTAICYGLAAVAALGFIQKYFHVAPVLIVVPAAQGAWMSDFDICSTYRHRILFGYAMAMGVPVALALAGTFTEPRKRRGMYGIAMLLIAADYFSTSRGPWLGLGIGTVAMAIIGGKAIRKKLALIAALTAAVLILRPGVRATIQNLYQETFDSDTQKGDSFETRWQLWHIAWTEVRRTPLTFLFGLGPDSTESLDFTDYFEGEGAGSAVMKIGHTSWDNNFASDLIEFGVVGFALELILFASIVRVLLGHWRRADPDSRIIRAALAISCIVFMFAMTNVFIFSAQLKYLFWALVAIGSNARWTLADQRQKTSDTLPDGSTIFIGSSPYNI